MKFVATCDVGLPGGPEMTGCGFLDVLATDKGPASVKRDAALRYFPPSGCAMDGKPTLPSVGAVGWVTDPE